MPVIIVGTNSWVTIVYADAYFESQWGASEWATLTNTQKTQLLIHAYRWIQQQYFFSISPASTAEIVKQAQCETAWYIYNYWSEHVKRRALQEQGVTRFDIMSFSESFKKIIFPDYIKDMLADYIDDDGGQFPLINRNYP